MIGVVDYGLGNLKAFLNIYEKLNIPCQLIQKPSDFEQISNIILPGVGSFDAAMQALKSSGLYEKLNEQVLEINKPVLGVCVGMQIMAKASEEGQESGLAWIDAKVKKLDAVNYPLPHMGWNNLSIKKNSLLLNSIQDPDFYFLHSYYVECNDQSIVLAQANYPNSFCAMLNKSNIYGIQCHPEKSHEAGISVLKNFAELG